jgi:hypothetical protein
MKRTILKSGTVAIVIAMLHFFALLALSARQASTLNRAMETGDKELFRKVHFAENRFRIFAFPATQLFERPTLIVYAGSSLFWGLCFFMITFGISQLAGIKKDRCVEHHNPA